MELLIGKKLVRTDSWRVVSKVLHFSFELWNYFFGGKNNL